MALGRRVKIERERLGMTQYELAKAVGRSTSYIQSLENRDSKKTQNTGLLAQVLNVTPEYLESGLTSTTPDIKIETSTEKPIQLEIDVLQLERTIYYLDGEFQDWRSKEPHVIARLIGTFYENQGKEHSNQAGSTSGHRA